MLENKNNEVLTEEETETKTSSPSKQKRKYRAIEWSCFAGEFVSVAAPFVAIAIVNYDKYFVQYNGTQMSISFFMALAVMGFAIWGITKKKLQNSFITFMIAWATIAFIFQMMGEMILDIATIMWFGLIGLAGAYGLDLGSKAAKKKKEKIISAYEQADKDDLVEAVKEEKKQKVKVRIKK